MRLRRKGGHEGEGEKLQREMGITMGALERGTAGRGEALAAGHSKGPSALTGRREMWNCQSWTLWSPPAKPGSSCLTRSLKEQIPASWLQDSDSDEWEQQLLPKINCPAVAAKITDRCRWRGVVRFFQPWVVKVKTTPEKREKNPEITEVKQD